VSTTSEQEPGKGRHFRGHTREQIAAASWRLQMDTLSTGMSHDFEAAIEVAIEEGSTCVRVGTAIFGERPKPAA
jgi:uncharacterized pyridoxal phosphate-containing UPF0001 family protein